MIKKLIQKKKKLIFIESHSPLSSLIIEKAFYKDIKTNKEYKFDGIWSSSLADSVCQGMEDNETLDLKTRIKNIFNIRSVTSLPIIMDADSGGNIEHFCYYIKIMQQVGINAVVIEDKKGIKKNSLLGLKVKQDLEDIEVFCKKIFLGKKKVYNKDFLIIARMEGLIAGKSIQETIDRAFKATAAGADGILIHSISKTPQQVIDFTTIYKKKYPNIPLICIPTTYSSVKHTELSNIGIKIIIYANHMIRSSYKIMEYISNLILKNKRTLEIEKECISIDKILNLTKNSLNNNE